MRVSPLATRLRRRRGDETGAVVVLVAAMSLIFFGIAALVVDLGQARVVRREAQAASDASALAGMNAMYVSGTKTPDLPGAVAAVKSYAAKNYGITDADWAECEDPAPLTHVPDPTQPCISFDSAAEPTTVRVIAPLRTVQLNFAAALGFDTVDVSAHAQATMRIGGQADCGLCVIGHSYHDFQNGDAYISGGDVAINGDVNIQNNGLVSTDGVISVEGDATGPLDGYTPDPLEGQEPVADPLLNAPLPTSPSRPTRAEPAARTGPASTAATTSRTAPARCSPACTSSPASGSSPVVQRWTRRAGSRCSSPAARRRRRAPAPHPARTAVGSTAPATATSASPRHRPTRGRAWRSSTTGSTPATSTSAATVRHWL